MQIRTLIKSLLPDFFLSYLYKVHLRTRGGNYNAMTNKQVFTKIYKEHVWGSDNSNLHVHFSGGGSHDVPSSDAYVSAVADFISRLPNKPDVIDLGCGDFRIGSRIRPLCNKYIACDIVDHVVQDNRENYRDLGVDFRVFDFTREKCEQADIIFVRHVFQHLSNHDIQLALKNIVPNCHYLVLTEHFLTSPASGATWTYPPGLVPGLK